MLKVQELKELIKALDQSSLDELKFEQDGTKLVLKKQVAPVSAVERVVETQSEAIPVAAPVATSTTVVQQEKGPEQVVTKNQETAANANLHTITSPMVGTFYSAPSPDSDPYVKQGVQVTEESVVCIVEAMKLMNEIEAEVKGKIVEILAENGELVEYGQPLFVVELV